jgi:hypothetical protein
MVGFTIVVVFVGWVSDAMVEVSTDAESRGIETVEVRNGQRPRVDCVVIEVEQLLS